jgi:hypothetical protein
LPVAIGLFGTFIMPLGSSVVHAPSASATVIIVINNRNITP